MILSKGTNREDYRIVMRSGSSYFSDPQFGLAFPYGTRENTVPPVRGKCIIVIEPMKDEPATGMGPMII